MFRYLTGQGKSFERLVVIKEKLGHLLSQRWNNNTETNNTPQQPAWESGTSYSIITFHDLLTCRNGMWLSVLSACHSFFTPILSRRHAQTQPQTHLKASRSTSYTSPVLREYNSWELVIIVTSAGNVKCEGSEWEDRTKVGKTSAHTVSEYRKPGKPYNAAWKVGPTGQTHCYKG